MLLPGSLIFIAKKLPDSEFLRWHSEDIFNLSRARMLTPRNSRDYDLGLDSSVNRRILIARDRLRQIRKILGV